MKNISVGLLILLAITYQSVLAQAVIPGPGPDIRGTYTGTMTQVLTGCDVPAQNGTTTVSISLTLTTQVDDGEGGYSLTGTFTGPATNAFAAQSGTAINMYMDQATQSVDISFIYSVFSTGSYANGTISGTGSTSSTSCGTSSSASISFTLTTGSSSSSGSIIVADNTPSASVINNVGILTSTVYNLTSVMSSRINGIINNSIRGFNLVGNRPVLSADLGKAAGDEWQGVSVWGSYSAMKLENDSAADFDGYRHALMAGIDYQPRDNMVAGLMVSYESSDLDSRFNLGNLQSDGFTIAPYFGLAIDDNWSMDMLLGYGTMDIDQYHRGSGTLVTSDTQTNRLFFAANLNYGFIYEQFYLEGRGGISSADEQQDAYIESNGTTQRALRTAFTQLQLGGRATYLGFDSFNPYIGLSYNYDASANTPLVLTPAGAVIETDNDDMLSSVGFKWQEKDNLSVGFEWSHRFSRKFLSEDAINLDVRMTF